eukprot:3123580-Heterocapsa_arctica.AAC.1
MRESARVDFFTENGLARKWRMSTATSPPEQLNGEPDHTEWPELIGEHVCKQFDSGQVERTIWASNMKKSLE